MRSASVRAVGRLFRRFGERVEADDVELGCDRELGRALRRCELWLRERRGERGFTARMQWFAREDLEQDRTERVDVCGGRDVAAAHLLRRHVPWRAEDRALGRVAVLAVDGLILHHHHRRGRPEAIGEHARHAPIDHIDLAEVAEHDVRGLEIAVNHAARVRELDREAHVDERPEERLDRRAIREPLPQSLAGEALHGEVRATLGVGAELVDWNDRRVIEAGLDPCFAQEPRHRIVRRRMRANAFDRDLAPDALILRDHDLAHAAATDQLAELVSGIG